MQNNRRFLLALGFILACCSAGVRAQEIKLTDAQREMNMQVSQDKAMKQAQKDLKTSSFKGAVRKQVEYGHAAFGQEQYALALDRYLRAYEKETDSANRMAITYMMGQTQMLLNHPKVASQHLNKLWLAGERGINFLKSYVEALFSIGNYEMAEKVMRELEKRGENSARTQARRESLDRLDEAEAMQHAFGLRVDDVIFDSALNTAFSEYGPTFVDGQLYFSSSRLKKGQTLSDPRTGQGYSRLFSASYDPALKQWINPVEVDGEVANLHGNVGTFSFDAVHNIGYFTWSQGKNTGIFTVNREGGSWTNRQVFEFNYMAGADDFMGKVAHPSVSADGKRLLFVYRDPVTGNADIWMVERAVKIEKPAAKKKKRGNTSSSATPTSTANASRSKKKQASAGPQAVIVNDDWGVPVRMSDEVNSPGREAFPNWVNDSMFVFSSDGHPGNGGTDLFLAIINKNKPGEVNSVGIFPRPVNSSYDDDALLPDPEHGMMLIASNRYTTWGKTENLYIVRKSGLKHEVYGNIYMLPRDTMEQPAPKAGATGARAANGLKMDINSVAQRILRKDTVLAARVKAGDVKAKRTLDSLVMAAGAVPASSVDKSSKSGGGTAVATAFVAGSGPAAAQAVMPLEEDKIDTLAERQKVHEYYVMVTNDASAFYESVSPDSSGLYRISYLEPGDYNFTVYADGYKDFKQTLSLGDAEVLMPVLLKHRLDFMVQSKALKKKPVPPPAPKPKDTIKPAPKPKTDTLKPAPKPKPPVAMKMPEKPKEIIKTLDTMKRYIPKSEEHQKRQMDTYKSRVNNPMRRLELTAVPPKVKCEVCGEKDFWKKNANETVYVSASDDKALITLTDPQGRVSYFDIPQNSVYAIETQVMANNKGPSLPTGISQNDIRRKVVTRDYILFECVPKLSELGDEYYINNVYFDFDKSDLIKDAPRELDRIIIVAIKNPTVSFVVEAHADERGTLEYNDALAKRRLDTVLSYIEKKGVDMSRVIGKSIGERDPLIAGANTEDEHRLNRRTTFRLVKNGATNVKKGDADYPVEEFAPENKNYVTFMVQLGAFARPLDNPTEYYANVLQNEPNLKITYYMGEDGYYKYNVGGVFTDVEKARALVKRILKYRECYIAAFYKGRRITVSEALKVINHKKTK